ncbi:MAG TPA: hypothetical protein VK449_09790 [Anaerolineales bacterium]|nr:hypothetical protein [Anaerolineales bacterium]
MFDNLRDLSEGQPAAKPAAAPPVEEYRAPGSGRMFGMTPGQRLVISMLLFFAVLLLGTMCLLVTQRVILG